MQIPWLEIHGALTHFPPALLVTALAFEIGAILFTKSEWRIVSFWLIMVAALSALPAVISGLQANHMIFGAHEPPLIPTHRLGGYVTAVLAILLAILRIAQGKNSEVRAAVVSSMVLLIFASGASVYTGYLGGKMVFGDEPMPADSSAAGAADTSSPATGEPTNLIALGRTAYESNSCQSCHSINGVGGNDGPNLTDEGRRHPEMSWQIQHLKNPASVSPGSGMPPYDDLPAGTLKALAAYLVSRN